MLEDRFAPSTGDLLLTLPDPAPTPAGRFGSSVAMDDRYVVVGAPDDAVGGVPDAGSANVFDRGTGNLVFAIPNPEPHAGDRFGQSVVIAAGHGYIGVPGASRGGVTHSGAVYGFALPNSGYIGNFWLDSPSPAPGAEFGYSLARDNQVQWLAIGAPGQDNGAGRVYSTPFDAGVVHGPVARNPNPALGARFGESVGVNVFGQLLIGAPGADAGGVAGAGRAYVYDRDVQAVVATLADPAPTAGGRFGASVAISGTTMIALIGAPGEDAGGVSAAGSAFAFDLTQGTSTSGNLLATLANPDPTAGAHFGASVAASELVALVGAPDADAGGVADAGTAYEFRDTTGELLATLANPDPTAGDQFGTVALFENRGVVTAALASTGCLSAAGSGYVYDTDNPPRVSNHQAVVPRDAGPTPVVALGTDSELPDLGKTLTVAEVSQGVNGGAVEVQPDHLTVTYAPPAGFVGSDSFSYTVDDGRGGQATGTVTVLVVNPPGAGLVATLDTPSGPGNHGLGTDVAASDRWVLVRPGSVEPIEVHEAATGALVGTLPNPPRSGFFATSTLAVSGDRALVGSDVLRQAYLYDLPTGTLLRTFLPPSNIPLFGISVALDGDTVVIGSFEDQEAFGSPNPGRPGRVFVYNAATGALTRTVTDPTFNFQMQGFGSAVAVAGDTLVVGAPYQHVAANLPPGQAFVFDLATGTLLRTFNSAARHLNQLFGISVAVSGNRLVVGAREQAYVFDVTTGGLLANLGDPTPTLNTQFGVDVGIAGDRVLVGAAKDDRFGLSQTGSAYLFDAATGTYLRSFEDPHPAAGDWFGNSVALAGNRAVVGTSPLRPAAGAGAAYLFDLTFPPTARDDHFTVTKNSRPTVFDVLANDFTVPGDAVLSVTGVSRAGHGTVTLIDGVVRYVPDKHYSGADSFTYTVSDGRGGTATATVNVTVVPRAGPPRHPGGPGDRRVTWDRESFREVPTWWWLETVLRDEDPVTGCHRRG
jgi:hypothetical protein